MSKRKAERTHKFMIRVVFDRSVTPAIAKKEARGSLVGFSDWTEGDCAAGTLKVTALKPLPSPAQNVGRVKPLTWERSGGHIHYSVGGIVAYSIQPEDANGLPYSFRTNETPAQYYIMGPATHEQRFADIDTAKDHVQASYEALILSAFLPMERSDG